MVNCRCAAGRTPVGFPLSLALSRKGRGDALFEWIEGFPSRCRNKLSVDSGS